MKGLPINHGGYAKYSKALSIGVYILSDYTKHSSVLAARAYAHARDRVMHTPEGGAAGTTDVPSVAAAHWDNGRPVRCSGCPSSVGATGRMPVVPVVREGGAA